MQVIFHRVEKLFSITSKMKDLNQSQAKQFHTRYLNLHTSIQETDNEILVLLSEKIMVILDELSSSESIDSNAIARFNYAVGELAGALDDDFVVEATGDFEEESDDDLFSDYLVEMNEYIEQIEQEIMVLEEDTSDPETLHKVFRLFHTAKGTSGIMQHKKLSKICHIAEDLLDSARDGDYR